MRIAVFCSILLGLDSTAAIKVSQKTVAATHLGLQTEIQSLSASVQAALEKSGSVAGLVADSDLKNLINQEVTEQLTGQKTPKKVSITQLTA